MKNLLAPLSALLVAVSASGCGEVCSNDQIAVVASPSGKAKAVVFHRNCGATTDANTQVAVVPSYVTLANIPGNALVLGGDVPLQVRWASDTLLVITGLGSARVFKQEESVTGVLIAYGKQPAAKP